MRATFGDAEAGFATVSVAAESVHDEVENETASVRAVGSGSAARAGFGSANASYAHLGACARVTSACVAVVSEEAAIGILNVDEVASTVEDVSGIMVERWKRERTPPPRPPHPLSRGLPPRSSSNPLPPRPLPLPRPRPLIRASRSPSRISSRRARRSRSSNARVSPIRAWRISAFFSSTNVCGTPAGESWASRSNFHRADMNSAVCLVRKPVRLICIFLGSGV